MAPKAMARSKPSKKEAAEGDDWKGFADGTETLEDLLKADGEE